jgi:hypothetical protein
MKIVLYKKNTKELIEVEFTPYATVPISNLHLVIYGKNVNVAYGEGGHGWMCEPFNQLYIANINHIMHGKLEFEGKEFEAQVAFILASCKMFFEPYLIYYYPISTGLMDMFNSSSYGIRQGEFSYIRVVDYKNYCETVQLIGNKPALSFRQYVLNAVFESMDKIFDPILRNSLETSYFNVVDNPKNAEDDFITSKGMTLFLEETQEKKIEDYYKNV